MEKALRTFLVQFYDLSGQKDSLLKFFKQADEDHDGMISLEELEKICG